MESQSKAFSRLHNANEKKRKKGQSTIKKTISNDYFFIQMSVCAAGRYLNLT